MPSRKIIAIIPAAGVGSRMEAGKAKQYLLLEGKTILQHSIELFLQHNEIARIIVAISPEDEEARQLPLYGHAKIQWVMGGKNRADSVLNALKAIEDTHNTWVLVHDAARPCLRWQEVEKLLQVENPQGAILAIPVVDTLKKAFAQKNGIEKTVDRAQLWQAQTPQFFPAQALRDNLQKALKQGADITDEASAMEFCQATPELVLGRKSNLKITYPEDLALAEFYLREKI